MGRDSLYLNFGWWEDGQTNYDTACEALAIELGEAAGMKSGERLLDTGCGFGDQDLLWLERFGLEHITAVNISERQVRRARERVAERELSEQIDVVHGSATATELPSASYDVVTALETAFHYDTREEFFREAYRVLAPGGRLALADPIPQEGSLSSLRFRMEMRVNRAFWQIPADNVYEPTAYRDKLAQAGFEGIEMRSIRDRVYPGLLEFMRNAADTPDYQQRFDPVFLKGLRSVGGSTTAFNGMDYFIVTATKPAA
ncbi:MAG: methyltransferase domain-containing protein [Myxococcota bacterium]